MGLSQILTSNLHVSHFYFLAVNILYKSLFYVYNNSHAGTQGYRFGLKKKPRDKNSKRNLGDPKLQEENMECSLANIDTLEEQPVFIDPVEEVRESVENVIAEHKEEIFGSFDENANIIPKVSMLGEPKKKEKGKKEENISMRQFWRYRMFYSRELMEQDKNTRFHWLWTMRKLAEYFVITVENRS